MSLGPGGRRYLRLCGEVPIVATSPPGQDPDDPARVSFPTYDGDVDDAVDADADGDVDDAVDADDPDDPARVSFPYGGDVDDACRAVLNQT